MIWSYVGPDWFKFAGSLEDLRQENAEHDAAELREQEIDDAWWDAREREQDADRDYHEAVGADLRAADEAKDRRKQWEEDYYAALAEEQRKVDRE